MYVSTDLGYYHGIRIIGGLVVVGIGHAVGKVDRQEEEAQTCGKVSARNIYGRAFSGGQ